MQDPAAAAAELDRCAAQLGFPGVMLNGDQNVGDAATGWYYDHERFLPFWERTEALGVPVYLQPRDPLPGNQGIYEGHPELFGAVSTFTVETATHALRLMTSGLFDRFPRLTVILGHLGETLPFNVWRINHRVSFMGDLTKFQQPLTHYMLHNFYVTTSGNFHTQTLNATLAELGADRLPLRVHARGGRLVRQRRHQPERPGQDRPRERQAPVSRLAGAAAPRTLREPDGGASRTADAQAGPRYVPDLCDRAVFAVRYRIGPRPRARTALGLGVKVNRERVERLFSG